MERGCNKSGQINPTHTIYCLSDKFSPQYIVGRAVILCLLLQPQIFLSFSVNGDISPLARYTHACSRNILIEYDSLAPDLAVAVDNEFCGSQLLHSHRAAGV